MPCRVRVLSEITRGEETERMELECGGEYLFSPEKTVIRYTEKTEYGPVADTVAVITEAGAAKAAVRRGEALYLELVCGEKHTGEYALPFGVIDMEYTAVALDTAFGEDGGWADMKYLMNIGGAESENRVLLQIMTLKRDS